MAIAISFYAPQKGAFFKMIGKLVEIEQAAKNALNIIENSRNPITPEMAVARVFRHEGRDILQPMLCSIADSGISPDIDALLKDLSDSQIKNFKKACGLILAGSICPLVYGIKTNEWGGWHTETMFSFWNEAIRGLPVPTLSQQRIQDDTYVEQFAVSIKLNDKANNAAITKIMELNPGKNEQFFFTNEKTLAKIPAVSLVIIRFNGIFTNQLLDGANDYLSVMNCTIWR